MPDGIDVGTDHVARTKEKERVVKKWKDLTVVIDNMVLLWFLQFADDCRRISTVDSFSFLKYNSCPIVNVYCMF